MPRFADDIAILTESVEEFMEVLGEMEDGFAKAKVFLVSRHGISSEVTLQKRRLEKFTYLGSKITWWTKQKRLGEKYKQPTLHRRNTDWNLFREKLDEAVSLIIPLKNNNELEEAVWPATPEFTRMKMKENISYTMIQKIVEKRQICK